MAMVHLRVVCPAATGEQAMRLLSGREGVVAVGIGRLAESDAGRVVVHADLARECADNTLRELKRLGVTDDGMITLDPIDTALGDLVDAAEHDAPGEGADAMVWDELTVRTGEDSQLTWTFGTFMVLATLLASIGIMTDSPITIVGAMVVGPEFGPLAGLAVGLVRRRRTIARRAAIALLAGFPIAIVGAAIFALLARAAGLISGDVLSGHRQTEFIYHPGWFSLITALVAGTAGMLSLTSSKSAALVGVFISVTTIPAAGNVAVAVVLTDWYEAGQSAAQLGINLVGIVAAGTVTLFLRSAR